MRFSSIRAVALALFLAIVGNAGALAQQQPENIAQENSDQVARKLAAILLERQTGAPVPPDKYSAYEADFNLDGFSELYVYVDAPACDGIKCGLFVFVLEGDSYREVLGGIPGARLADPAKVFLGTYKRNGFIDLQLDQMLVSFDGKRYADASTFPASTLDGTAFFAACTKSKSSETSDLGEAEKAVADCRCALDRFQAIGATQGDLDNYAAYLGGTYNYPEQARPDAVSATLANAEDVGTGCDVASGKIQWQPASFTHGGQPQQRLDFDGFIDACVTQDWITGHRKIGSPDRALGLCGCLARELPTYGVTQDSMDLLTRYYRGDMSDADIDAKQSDLLTSHDAASEACLRQFPEK